MADLPGIIEGASEGKGIGLRFLRHIERNLLLLFLIAADSDDIQKEYRILDNELNKYNPELAEKNRVLAITKSDLLDNELRDALSKDLPDNIPSIFISSVTHQGIMELKDLLWEELNRETFHDAQQIIRRDMDMKLLSFPDEDGDFKIPEYLEDNE